MVGRGGQGVSLTPARHPCFKRQVRCEIIRRTPKGTVTLSVGTNSCISKRPGECARVWVEAEAGEQYELCGPPIHAELAALDNLDPREVIGMDAVLGLEAHVYGQDWVCKPCGAALFGAGIARIVMHGRPERLNTVLESVKEDE